LDQPETKVIQVEREGPPRKLTPQELLDEMVKAFPKLTETQRQHFSARLAEAGYKVTKVVETERPAAPPQTIDLPEATVRKLGERGQIRVYPTQILNLFHELLDCTVTLAAAAQGVLKAMYRQGDVAHPPEMEEEQQLRSTIARYCKGEAGVTPEQMRLAVQKVRVRLATMLRIPGELPGKMCNRLRLIHPESIRDTVRRQTRFGALLKDEKVSCWDTFEDRWNKLGLGQTQESVYWDVDFAKDVVTIADPQNGPR
jgi:hypothetical protein